MLEDERQAGAHHQAGAGSWDSSPQGGAKLPVDLSPQSVCWNFCHIPRAAGSQDELRAAGVFHLCRRLSAQDTKVMRSLCC